MSIRNRVRAGVARYRLRGHMYERLIHGGTPDCPCARCEGDRTLLERLGVVWDEPERALYYRDLERAMQRGGYEPRAEGPPPTEPPPRPSGRR